MQNCWVSCCYVGRIYPRYSACAHLQYQISKLHIGILGERLPSPQAVPHRLSCSLRPPSQKIQRFQPNPFHLPLQQIPRHPFLPPNGQQVLVHPRYRRLLYFPQKIEKLSLWRPLQLQSSCPCYCSSDLRYLHQSWKQGLDLRDNCIPAHSIPQNRELPPGDCQPHL